MRLIRIVEGIKAKNMAAKLEITPSYLSLIENGKKKPSMDTIEKFACVVGVRPSQIMFFSEELNDDLESDRESGVLTKLTRPLMLKWLKAIASRHEDEE